VDAGVLIATARGGNVQAARAMEILDDPEREFAASVFLRLEVLPQAVFNKRVAEAAFYDAFFSTAASRYARHQSTGSRRWTLSMSRRRHLSAHPN
jgi:hypothetical protein